MVCIQPSFAGWFVYVYALDLSAELVACSTLNV